MRESLVTSLSQDPGFEGYPKGSIIVCGSCWKPIYALERGLAPGEKCGRGASAFRPLTQADMADLVTRPDLDVSWRGLLSAYMLTEDAAAVFGAKRPNAGDAAVCPVCDGQFLKARADTVAEVHDRANVMEMLWIAPLRGATHPILGTQTRWTM